MATNGFLVYNLTQKNEKIFTSQIKVWQEAFKLEKTKLNIVDNLSALNQIKKAKQVDFVLFWDKDIALAYQIMNLGIKVFNNVDAIRMCDDKAYTFALLNKKGVKTPKTVILPLTFYVEIDRYFNEISKLITASGIKYPFVVKERRSSLGLGVFLIHNEKEFKKILVNKGQRELIIQEYIGDEFGTDYRVYLINHKPEAVVTRVNTKDFRSNVEQGGKMSVLDNPSNELLKQATLASKALGLNFGAVDLVRSKKNGYLVLEVNSNARTATIDKLTKTPLTRSVAKYIINNI